ncbi:MAG TPA: TetR/AcrR family transcriptional regulator, partial [Flavobacterium alvei]|nr:TetR/AcrR family transcriptional regulator [Flavobacterium alvei]
RELNECNAVFKQNIVKGIEQGLYRKETPIDTYVEFYYTLIFSINGKISSEKEANEKELLALEYHTRAMATPEGIIELEKQLINYHL